ncbi:RNA-directed DNA polymerase, eukaryota, reverse transcriptase zinc-binding domain protein [Tanacetum coccineum]
MVDGRGIGLDSWSWLLGDKGIFTVKSLREKIDEVALNATITPQKTKWNTYIPRKTCIFVWRLQQRRLPVRSWLHHIGMDLNTILCPHCDTDIETFEHCFMSCPRVVTGWEKVFKWWNMGNFNVGSVGDIINYNGQNNYNAMQKKCWQAVCWGMLAKGKIVSWIEWCIDPVYASKGAVSCESYCSLLLLTATAHGYSSQLQLTATAHSHCYF